MKILIVDDNIDGRKILKMMLESEGYSVFEAKNGHEALLVARNTNPDLIITDVLMPVMDGFRLCIEIKKDPVLRNIPVVFYTASYTDKEDMLLAEKIGVSKYIIKPVEPEKFLMTIKEMLYEYNQSRLKSKELTINDKSDIFKQYSERLLSKLESKLEEMQKLNREFYIAEKQWRLAFDAVSDFISIQDPEFKFMKVNRALCEFLGMSQKELLGKHCYEIIHKMDKPWEGCPHIEAIQNRRSVIKEIDDPTIGFPLIVTTSPIYDETGSIIATINIAKDISFRKKREIDIAQSRSELSVLYRLSAKLNRTKNMDDIFSCVLESITNLEVFAIERKGGIFLIDGDRLILSAYLEHTAEFVNIHKNIRLGQCLCGLAAVKGEIIVSKNSSNDPRHTIKYQGMTPHGHVIVPLRADNNIKGILYLYTPPDYIIPDSRLRLLEAIGNQIGMAIDRVQLYEEARRDSLHDPLTGLANRRYMEVFLKNTFERAKRHSEPLSVLMIDIDHFKRFNDEHGHVEGDRLLQKISIILSSETRVIDLVVRYGGEEFLILLPETTVESAKNVADRIRSKIKDETGISVSVGITGFSPDIKTTKDLIERADRALYKAKDLGRDRIEIL